MIYNFFMYLLRYLAEEYGDVDAYFSTKDDVPHMWGVQYMLAPWRMGGDFFWECKKVGTAADRTPPPVLPLLHARQRLQLRQHDAALLHGRLRLQWHTGSWCGGRRPHSADVRHPAASSAGVNCQAGGHA